MGDKKPSRSRRRKAKSKGHRREARGSQAGESPVLPAGAMDAGAPRPEGGENGDPSPGPKPGTGGADRVSPARTLDRLRPQAAHPQGPARPVVRPYRLRTASDAVSALEFASWFSQQRGEALGVALQDQTLGFANGEEGWQAPLGRHDLVDDAVKNALAAFTGSDSPLLIFQDAAQTIPALAPLLQKTIDPKGLLKLMVGDLQVLQDCVGRRIERGSFSAASDEAYAAFTAEQQWGTGAPAFYRSVGLPRLSQQIYVASSPPEGVPWRISYSDLFLRVLAHFTREPTLVAALVDGKDPVAELGPRLAVDDEEQFIAIMFWAATGFDTVYLSEHHPKVFTLLPDGLADLRQAIERQFSTLCLNGWIHYREEYTQNRRLQTLYGRWLLWGLSLPEALAQMWLGSVQDILDVAETATASFWSEDPLPVYPVMEELLERVIRVRGGAPNNRSKWLPLLEGVAESQNPLSIPLAPAVIWNE